MGEKVDRLVELARVYVPPHVAVVGGKTIHVAGYTRTVQSGFRSSVAAGGGGTYGEGGMGPARRIEVTADENNMGRPKVSGPVISWTQDDGVELERGVAYTWDMGGVTYTGTFSGIHGGSESTANDRALMRDVDATYPDGATKTHEQFYAPRSGVRSLEEVDKEVREAAYKQDISPVEYLRTKMSRVELAQTRVGRYLRKGETGKVEDVNAYIRKGVLYHGQEVPRETLPKRPPKPRWKQPRPKVPKIEPGKVTVKKGTPAAAPSGEFLGHDEDGNEIKVGSKVVVESGPDKGQRGTVRGVSKGGGIQVEVIGNLGKRTVLVDPDELRVKSR